MTTTTLREILGNRPLYSVTPDTALRDVARVMAANRVGAVAVIAQPSDPGSDGTLVGIVSERDLVFRGLAGELPLDSATARDVMTPDPVCAEIDMPISGALAAHLGDHFRHLPVTDAGRIVGLISYRDIPAEYVMMFERFREMASAHADDRA